MSWLSSAINKVKKWQPGKTQWKDAANAGKWVVPAVLGATGVGLPFAAAAGAGLSAAGAGKRATLGTVLKGGLSGAAAGMTGGMLGGAAQGAKAGFTAGDGILSALGGGAKGLATGAYQGVTPNAGWSGTGSMSPKSLVGKLGFGGAQEAGAAPTGIRGAIGTGMDMAGTGMNVAGAMGGGDGGGFFGGMSGAEKAALIAQVLSGGAGVYGAYSQGQREDEMYDREWGDRKAAGAAFAPYLQKYLNRGG